MYQHGVDKNIDEGIKRKEHMKQFLVQGINECSDMNESVSKLFNVLSAQH